MQPKLDDWMIHLAMKAKEFIFISYISMFTINDFSASLS